MPESSSNEHNPSKQTANELFSKLSITTETQFFIRLRRKTISKNLTNISVTRWRTKENWQVPMFTSDEGKP